MSQSSLRTRMLEAFRKRIFVFTAVILLVFVVLVIQLINLQIVHRQEYTIKARMNMENNVPIPAPRGEIYDRNYRINSSGKILVSNRPSFNITLVPESYENKLQMRTELMKLSKFIDLDVAQVMGRIRKSNPWKRIIIKEDVDFKTVTKIASHHYLFSKIDWEDAPVRVYNYGDIFSHSIGYIGSITKKEYEALRGVGYKYYQSLGKSGIEKQYDSILRGEDGHIRRIVDVKNRTEGEEVGKAPLAGDNLRLTLDFDVQQAAFDALGQKRGAVVVIKPATGEVLALVSKPSFNPNHIVSRNNASLLREMYRDKMKPFLNRAIQSKYPPASTFKLITAIAALETERTYPAKLYRCTGKYTLKGYRDHDFYCFKNHGTLDLYRAIGKSCSSYFYQLGYRVGPTSIMKYAEYMGLSEKTQVDIPGEIAGFIPSKKWKLKTFGQPWFDGDTINMSIGQGFLAVTPMGLVNMLCVIVNNGIVYKPHLLKEIYSSDNKHVIRTVHKQKLREIPLSPVTLDTIKKGMRKSVTIGSSGILKRLKVPICGKTGTAQTRSRRKENKSQHAWWIGYAPFGGDAKQSVVVGVFIEYGEWGAVAAVPVAKKVFEKLIEKNYFKRN